MATADAGPTPRRGVIGVMRRRLAAVVSIVALAVAAAALISDGGYVPRLSAVIVGAALVWLLGTVWQGEQGMATPLLVVAAVCGLETVTRRATSAPRAAALGWVLVVCAAVCSWAVRVPVRPADRRAASLGVGRIVRAAAVGTIGGVVAVVVDRPASALAYGWFALGAGGVLAAVLAVRVALRTPTQPP